MQRSFSTSRLYSPLQVHFIAQICGAAMRKNSLWLHTIWCLLFFALHHDLYATIFSHFSIRWCVLFHTFTFPVRSWNNVHFHLPSLERVVHESTSISINVRGINQINMVQSYFTQNRHTIVAQIQIVFRFLQLNWLILVWCDMTIQCMTTV